MLNGNVSVERQHHMSSLERGGQTVDLGDEENWTTFTRRAWEGGRRRLMNKFRGAVGQGMASNFLKGTRVSMFENNYTFQHR